MEADKSGAGEDSWRLFQGKQKQKQKTLSWAKAGAMDMESRKCPQGLVDWVPFMSFLVP